MLYYCMITIVQIAMSKTGRRDSPQTPRLKKVWKRQIRRNTEAVWQNGRSESRAERRPKQPLRQKYGPVC